MKDDRLKRISSIVMKNLSEIIQFEVKNPRIGFCTVNEVIVSKDFSHAKVFVSFLGSKFPKQNLEELEKCKGFIRSSLAKKMDTRKIPELHFFIDDTYDKADSLDKALAKEQQKIDDLNKKGE